METPIEPVLKRAMNDPEKMMKMRQAHDELLTTLLDCSTDFEIRKKLHAWWNAHVKNVGIQRRLTAMDVQKLLPKMPWEAILDAETQLGCRHLAEGVLKKNLFTFEVNGSAVSPNGPEFYTSIMVLQ